jgi:two-component sensor histidine kinase
MYENLSKAELIKQLQGRLLISRDHGTTVELTFPKIEAGDVERPE